MNRQEYTESVNAAKQHSYEYYVLSKPTISDAEFDALVAKIEQMEAEHPEWTLPDSPTQCVGSDLSGNGKRLVRHRTPMLSCQKAQDTAKVEQWIKQTEKKLKKQDYGIYYELEWKLDGISCSLVYQDGALISAATRGDGKQGSDLMAHVKVMATVPQEISENGRVEVRGEIVCPKSHLPLMAESYADCRSAASGICGKNYVTADTTLLEFVVWQLDGDESIGTESCAIDIAEDLGFKTCGYKGCWTPNVIKRLGEFAIERDALDWPTDGVVVKINTKPLAERMGYTDHHPKGSIAYKFPPQKTTTTVRRIEITVGTTGRRTPVCWFDPVTIGARTVEKASLGSEDTMRKLGVYEGCKVEVGLSNDVTPKVYRVI